MKFLLISFLSLMSFPLTAQNLKASEFKALVNLNVTDLEGKPLANQSIMFVSDVDLSEFVALTNDSGKAQLLLPKGKTYEVKYKDLVEKVKYSNLEVPSGRGKYSFDITIKFEPSDVVELKGVVYTENGELDNSSSIELDMMKEVLELNPKMEILITAHSDNSKNKEEAIKITEERAALIKKYFVEKGISADRIKTKGLGSLEPLFSNALPEGREKNNRIEIRVTKKYL